MDARSRRRKWFPAAATVLLAVAAVGYWGWTCTASYQLRRILANAPIEAALVQGVDVSSYVRALVAVGKFEEARRIARRVPDVGLRSAVLSHVAEALAKVGMTGDAVSTAKEASALRKWGRRNVTTRVLTLPHRDLRNALLGLLGQDL